ncbi:SDR family oxidoreductase [Gracilibacillus alcaliphilus]|uniref:SDR family oxidoreductase n=1 Tax=Gracilibacillus alcaliphilus TaxID=1401441 RepID=UPI0030840618|nr:NAD(P)-dependent dehydrogenase (short-subunit alcohol dehydrogenase family) [Gracilibacillus alcaliphilus]
MVERQVALVTGASSGFGLLTVIELAKAGYQVIATMRNLDKQGPLLEQAEKEQVRNQIVVWPLDVTDRAHIIRIPQKISETFQRLDVLVNNAGVSMGGFSEEISEQDWRTSMETNFFGVVFLTQACLPIMRQQQRGKIINISSVGGVVAFPGYSPYSASKFALEGFSESLRLEVAVYGIDVVLVEPGAYRTEIWSKGFSHIEHTSQADSPFRQPMQAVVSFGKLLTRQADQPIAVAKKIVLITQKRKPRLRYAMGKGAALAIALKSLLPWKIFEAVIIKQIHKK